MHGDIKEIVKKRFIVPYMADFLNKPAKILDIGSRDLNGSLKSIFSRKDWKYAGLDVRKGKNVDIVSKPYEYPIKDNEYDFVVSTSCFEHVEMFWLTFNEMVGVCKNGGKMIITAPHKEGIHKEPVDCWRFCPDGYKALAKWNGQCKVLEAWIAPRPTRHAFGIFEITK